MNRFSQLTLIVMVSLFLGIVLPSGEAAAEQKTFNEQVTRAWTYVAVDTVRPYGSRVPNITFHIEISPLPNWDGIGQKRPFAPKGDELKWTTAGTSSGGTAKVVFKRAQWLYAMWQPPNLLRSAAFSGHPAALGAAPPC
jgi:hypothetical protein